jgi:hypothetical protein
MGRACRKELVTDPTVSSPRAERYPSSSRVSFKLPQRLNSFRSNLLVRSTRPSLPQEAVLFRAAQNARKSNVPSEAGISKAALGRVSNAQCAFRLNSEKTSKPRTPTASSETTVGLSGRGLGTGAGPNCSDRAVGATARPSGGGSDPPVLKGDWYLRASDRPMSAAIAATNTPTESTLMNQAGLPQARGSTSRFGAYSVPPVLVVARSHRNYIAQATGDSHEPGYALHRSYVRASVAAGRATTQRLSELSRRLTTETSGLRVGTRLPLSSAVGI